MTLGEARVDVVTDADEDGVGALVGFTDALLKIGFRDHWLFSSPVGTNFN